MNTVYRSTCLGFQFHLSLFYKFSVQILHRCWNLSSAFGEIFLFLGTIVNRAVFRISTSYCSSLVQRNTAEFYILTLYPATLLNSLIIHSGNLFVDSLVFSKQTVMPSANRMIFFPSPIQVFIFLPHCTCEGLHYDSEQEDILSSSQFRGEDRALCH